MTLTPLGSELEERKRVLEDPRRYLYNAYLKQLGCSTTAVICRDKAELPPLFVLLVNKARLKQTNIEGIIQGKIQQCESNRENMIRVGSIWYFCAKGALF